MPSHTASTEFYKFSVSQLSQLKRNYFLNHPALSSDIPEKSYIRISIKKKKIQQKKKFSDFEKITWKLWCLSTNYYCLCSTDMGQRSFYFSKKANH